MKKRVLITDYGFPDVAIERGIIESAGFELLTAQCSQAASVIRAARDVDALLVQWAPIDADVIAKLAPRLKVIVRYGIGLDNIDLVAAKAAGIAVCNVPDYCIGEVADHSFALALALARQLPQTHARTCAGEWRITPPATMPALADLTYATAGFGRIAEAVLARARPFGFKLASHDPFVPAGKFAEAGVHRLSIDELLEDADILSLHLPLSAATRHFINAAALARMKRTALIINTSRGGLVDTLALADALSRGAIAGAGLDVFETEPLEDDHPLRRAPNTVLTSHTAWFSQRSVPRLQQLAAEEVVRALRGEALHYQVNR